MKIELLAREHFENVFKNEYISEDELNTAIETSQYLLKIICDGIGCGIVGLREVRNKHGLSKLTLILALDDGLEKLK